MMYCNFLLFPCTERNMSFNNASIALCASKTSLYCKIVRNDTYMKEQKVIFELLIYGPEIQITLQLQNESLQTSKH